MARLDEYLKRQRDRYGDKFNPAGLAHKFAGYYNTGQRIEVLFASGETKRGAVSATTGWEPSFMLMLTKRSIGSSWLLSEKDSVVAVIVDGKRISAAVSPRNDAIFSGPWPKTPEVAR